MTHRSRFPYAAVLLLAGCATAPPVPAPAAEPAAAPASAGLPVANREGLFATLWVQSSAEFEAAALQAYAVAGEALERALDDPGWTAALEQEGGDLGALPPAVILDVDDTVLDNTPYQARLITEGRAYDLDSWHAWCEERAAEPVPGALEFTRYATSLGVTVFYVTNRRFAVHEATRDNLARRGFPLDPRRDTVMTRGAQPEWAGSDKGPRRQAVAREFRVVQLLGDNLGDFVSGTDVSPAERAALVERYRDFWGSRWIVIPNPMYGSWRSALVGNESALPTDEVLRREYEALETSPPR